MDRRKWALGSVVVMAALIAGCGGGDDEDGNVQVRLVNASSGYASLTMKSGESTLATVARDAASSFAAVPASANSVELLAAGSTDVLLRPPVDSAGKDERYTVIAYGDSGALRHLGILETEAVATDTNKAKVLTVHVAGGTEALDVYLTPEATDLSSVQPVTGGLTTGRADGYKEVDKGTYRIRVAKSGSKTDLRMDASGLTLEGGKVYALALTTTPNSSMVNALLIPYSTSPSKVSNTVAATRVIAALPRSSTVGASINGQIHLPVVGSPAISPYFPVKAMTAPSLTWSVDGQPRPNTPLDVQIGGRYSVLVWGDPSAPQVTSILESTTVPVNGSAKLRVLNAVAGLGPVSLSLNLAPVVNGIAPGQLIETTLANVVDEQQLSVRAGATTIFSQTKRFSSGATYTIYLTGAPGMVDAQLVQH